jgi:thiamine-monophosphate kinase
VGKPAWEVELEFALHGGEDYELLFTSPPNRRVPSRIGGVPITQIGHITRGRNIFLTSRDDAGYKLEPRGWQHFRS